jgi:hypothetical protein
MNTITFISVVAAVVWGFIDIASNNFDALGYLVVGIFIVSGSSGSRSTV